MSTAFVKDPDQNQAFLVHAGGPLSLVMMGSAVQWNEDYAVTVKHLPYVPGAVFQGRGDVQFFRHKAAQAPLWRQYRPGEELTAIGFNSMYMPSTGRGQALGAMVRLDASDGGVLYATHNGATVKGMSGGPVFADDGRAVGISVAYLERSDLESLKRADLPPQAQVSIFLPYTEINREWQRFQTQLQAGGHPTPAPVGLSASLAVQGLPVKM
ncbi:trypsin-like peptidase domain-containing protein [Pseudomonas sp. DTU_2021_1001937_2_SI_NGA_ILE_001]|uniref:trypsin-like peptidase domain-containing protein n=1 Tax=Pseudomonas sp. DTU_2021_1001937_2_SI_NGA_ILE_001 TaxID=3077589 RepID=UPI0025F6FBD1|nr:trypsin-like peptidase domain-containing protein [Pseudomonas sp. DTU_2021_1001937_2_SI_NGA_ILE_001]WNW10357.1 trypsin-like peptidase domain-containing protein [Pseudomonas sp. DTU_2021_1001937_2_SI_NGA_ILE_001]